MALSLLCFAVPAFAQGAEAAGDQLGGNYRRIFHGDCFGLVRAGPGESYGISGGSLGTQSRGPSWHSAGADSRSGSDRVPRALHAGDHHCQGKVERSLKTEKLLADLQNTRKRWGTRLFFLNQMIQRLTSVAAYAFRPTRLPWSQTSFPESPSVYGAAGSGSPGRYSRSQIRLR